MLISAEYISANRALHARGGYGISGHKWAPSAHMLARAHEARDMLDYGCGSGTLRQALEAAHGLALPYKVLEYDPAIAGKETKPERADVVICGDVLEHVEPDCLYAVLDDIAGIARKAVLLIVATEPATKVLPDGRNAHLIVEPAAWWLPKLMQRWRITEFRDLGNKFVCVGVAG